MIPRERRFYRARRTRTIWIKDIGKSINTRTYNKWVINNVWTGSLQSKWNTYKHSYTAQLAKQAKRSSPLMRVITTVQIRRFGPFPRHSLPPILSIQTSRFLSTAFHAEYDYLLFSRSAKTACQELYNVVLSRATYCRFYCHNT